MALPFLFNGFEYVRYDTHIYRDGHPYFRVRDYGRGDIWYDGRYFPDRQLLFDAAREQVVIPADLKPGSYGQVALLPERVDSFSLQGLQFLHFRDSAQYRPGFYTRLHQGPKGTFYARYLKNFQKAVITNDGVWDVITDATYFEWETNGTFRVIHTQADLAKVLQVKTHLVKKYIRNQGLEFRKDHEAALLAAVRHFDPQ